MKQLLTQRIIPLLLVLTMVLGLAVPAGAAPKAGLTTTESLDFSPVQDDLSMSNIEEPVDMEQFEEEPLYADTDMVRVSIFMEQESTLEAGFSTVGISANAEAMAYRQGLKQEQAQLTARIESALGQKLDVAWNLTLAANAISANVPYGQLETISNIPGVKSVELETQHEPAVVAEEEAEPNMVAAAPMTGADFVWAAGFTGAGSRIAIIDTGTDADHQSFDAAGFEYSLAYQAGLQGMDAEEYIESLNLLDAEEVESLLGELNVAIDPNATYTSSKLPFSYNYIDRDYDITHDNDTQGGHGSHVAGIAAANAFVPKGDGTFVNALTETHVQGVAPDAQILTMKVFGKAGGAYTSDYMAAIEDAIVLGCDAVNLSLGSANPGHSFSYSYEEVMNALVDCDTVVSMAAGNSYGWAEQSASGVPYLYAEDVSFSTVGSPGSWINAFTVASAQNNSQHVQYIDVAGNMVTYTQSSYSNAPITTMIGDHEYVLVDGLGTPEDWAAVGSELEGKFALCSRGTLSFSEKANNAVAAGAKGVIIYNNTDGTINMDLTDYIYTAPVVAITQADGAIFKANGQEITDREGNPIYYVGEMTIPEGPGIISTESEYITMSSFSCWGVTDTLTLKPEITTPGGSIYSVDGEVDGGQAYVTYSGTSMASPHNAGLAALLAQYIRENGIAEKTGESPRHLINSLLMSTATPEIEEESGHYWSVMKQGAGMANVSAAISAGTYILMGEDATPSWRDGKVKAELGHDPERTGEYSFSFTVNNFSEEDKSYTLNSDFFTQGTFTYGEYDYLDTWTIPVAADVTYYVDGQRFRPTSSLLCDLDGDGDTDADDAQLILEYCIGNIESVDAAADVSGDGEITTYDAHMILNNLETQAFTVTPGSSVTVEVEWVYSEETKAWMDETYVNGAYIEGYVFALPVTTEEGETGVAHSIPVLGFYGDFNDASYFEKSNYWDKQYGTGKPNYTPYDPEVGALFVAKQDSAYVPAKEANPYMIEDEVPYDRLAVRSDDQLYMVPLTTIRMGSVAAAVSLDDNGQLNRLLNVETQSIPAFYYVNAGAWTNTRIYKFLVTHFGAMGAKEGEMVHFGFVVVPGMYLPTINPTTEEVVDAINNAPLGKGCYQIYDMVIDNTAPELLDVSKNLLNGSLTITATDAQYIASIQILSPDGLTVYANVLPEATEAGETTITTIDLSGLNIGSECVIALGDYAGNESLYTIPYGGQDANAVGNLFAYTNYTWRDEQSGWYAIDPDTLWYYGRYDNGGMAWQADCQLTIKAVEYVDGKVFVAADDGNFYVTEHGKWDEFSFICNYSSVLNNIYDMAYNPVDGLFYLTQGSTSTLYTMNPATGEVAKGPRVEGTKPSGGAPIYRYMRAIAITEDGTFYTANWGSGKTGSYVYSFTLDQLAANYKVAPVGNGTALGVSTSQFPSLAWDEASDTLYLVDNNSTDQDLSAERILYTVDMETGVAVRTNTDPYYDVYASVLNVPGVSLYTISDTDGVLPTTAEATGLTLNYETLEVLSGATATLKASVTPWNLTNKALSWSSSDSSVVKVNADGTITALQPGTSTITATTVAAPNLSAQCVITVEAAPELELTAQVTDSTGSWWADFSTSDPAGYTKLAESMFYPAGAIIDDEYFDDEVLVYSAQYNQMVGVDMDSFQITSDYGYLEDGWYWSDAAPCPTTKEGYFGGVATISHRGRYFMVEHPTISEEEYWVLTEIFLNDPMALIAYVETSTYNGNPATWYKVLTEGGALYDLVYFTADMGSSYQLGLGYRGETGIKLPSAGAVVEVSYGSMVYDAESGYLVVVASTPSKESTVYMVDPTTAIAAEVGTFGSDVQVVTTLNQYKRAENLEIVLNKTVASLYLGDSVTLASKVRPANYTNAVTWSSSDESILTVDADGIVTGLKEGTATVTATTVDTENGNPATATCTVTVKPLATLDTVISAQIETADGVYWADIDLSDMSVTINAESDVKYLGGGYANGFVYGSVGDLENGGWQHATYIDEGYVTRRYFYGPFNASSMILDATNAPAATYEYRGKEYNLFGGPVYIANNGFLGVSKKADPIGEDSTAARGLDVASGSGTGAIAFYDYSFVKTSGSLTGNPNYYFLVLSKGGTLYNVTVKADLADSFSGYYMGLSYATLGNVGMTFKNYDDLSMTTYRDVEKGINGLIVADSSYGKVSLYFIDMNAETLECAKIGTLENAIDLSCMYNDFNKITDIYQVPTAAQAGANAIVSEPAQTVTNDTMEIFSATTEPTQFLTETEVPVASTEETDENLTIGEGTVELTINATEANTNGILKITYDATLLTFTGISSSLSGSAYRVNSDDGIIYFDYATAWAMAEGTALGTLKFTFEAGCMNTDIKVTTLQRDDTNSVSGEITAYNLVYSEGGHTWSTIDYLAPTCFTDGYETQLCTVCGEMQTITLEANSDNCPCKNFTDLDNTQWYHEGIDFVLENDLMNGMSDTEFAPNGTLTRAQVVTVLYRMVGEPSVDGLNNPFTDVVANTWYTNAIIWAASKGIVNGMTETLFAPNQPITREQLVTILFRYSGEEATEEDFLADYTDAATVSEYAREAMNWAIANGIVQGVSETELSPKTTSTRAQFATILERYVNG